jgi:di/tricarboxylate transporter
MIITLAITIFMIVLILLDKLPFGAPPIIACALLVVTGAASMADAFSGFVDKNIIMIAGFLCVMAAFQKTTAIVKVKQTLYKMAGKGGYKNYILMLIIVMAGAMILSGTAYYVLVLSLVATIPYNEKMPNSRLVAPLGFATYFALFPIQYAFFYGIASSLLTSSGVTAVIPVSSYIAMNVIRSVCFFIWAIVGFKLLPNYDVNQDAEGKAAEVKIEEATLPKNKEKIVYAVIAVTVVCMLFLTQLGEPGYAIPAVAASVLLATGCLDFKEFRNNICSPMVLMMAGVVGVAGALASSGFTTLVGNSMASMFGAGINPIILVLVFTVLTSVCATFTGASFGSLFIFAPIAISTCIALGYSPVAMTISLTAAAWINWFMPIDGMPAMVMGVGKYKLVDFWKFTLPLWVIQILVTVIACVTFFPM